MLFLRVDAHIVIMTIHYQIAAALPRKAYFAAAYVVWTCFFAVVSLQTVRADTMTIFAASSLTEAVGEIAENYEDKTGVSATLVFAASSAIARQVAQGAPADVVLLADDAWADWLVDEGAVAAVSVFAGNRLVMIGQDPAPLASLGGLAAGLDGRVIAMASVDAVPAGRYGRAALSSLGLWSDVSGAVVQAANVRAALRFVVSGEALYAIGYASDLVAYPDLYEVYAFAPDTHPPILYSGAHVTNQGIDFMTYLQSDTAQAVLSDWGFAPAPSP